MEADLARSLAWRLAETLRLDDRDEERKIFDGYSWTAETASGPVSVRDIDQAIPIARQSIGELLRRVGR